RFGIPPNPGARASFARTTFSVTRAVKVGGGSRVCPTWVELTLTPSARGLTGRRRLGERPSPEREPAERGLPQGDRRVQRQLCLLDTDRLQVAFQERSRLRGRGVLLHEPVGFLSGLSALV